MQAEAIVNRFNDLSGGAGFLATMDPDDFFYQCDAYSIAQIEKLDGSYEVEILGVPCSVVVKVAMLTPDTNSMPCVMSYSFAGKVCSTGELIYDWVVPMVTVEKQPFEVLVAAKLHEFTLGFKDFDAMTYLNTRYGG